MGAAADVGMHGPAVELLGVAKAYRAHGSVVHAVRGLDISVEVGEVVALLGPNGAGKSTSLDMVLGLTRADEGTVSVFGQTPRQAVEAGRIGAMLQVGALIRDVSVRELIALVAALYPHPLEAEEVLELVDIHEIADRRTQKLSGGQAQRVRFALALTPDPDLLVLDEPTVGMDVESRRAFWGSMRAFAARERSVLFATHYLEEADAHADRAVLMARGRVVADGATSALRGRVGHRTLRATLDGGDLGRLEALPGVIAVDRRGDTVVLSCSDSDRTIRALLAAHPEACDIEIAAAPLEDAFVQLTADTNGATR